MMPDSNDYSDRIVFIHSDFLTLISFGLPFFAFHSFFEFVLAQQVFLSVLPFFSLF